MKLAFWVTISAIIANFIVYFGEYTANNASGGISGLLVVIGLLFSGITFAPFYIYIYVSMRSRRNYLTRMAIFVFSPMVSALFLYVLSGGRIIQRQDFMETFKEFIIVTYTSLACIFAAFIFDDLELPEEDN